jgi:hypothetical protein
VLIGQLPSDSATIRAMAEDAPPSDTPPDSGRWALTDQLLGHALDALQWANWQRGGGKGNRPQSVMSSYRPIARPDVGVDVRSLLQRGAPKEEGSG